MPRPRAFLVVGHKNWGKSSTLHALSGGRQRSTQVTGIDVRVKRMSNDDDDTGLAKYFKQLRPHVETRVLAAFCPHVTPPDLSGIRLLSILQPSYDLYFWVQVHSYGDGRTIAPAEIAALRGWGTVHEYRGQAQAAQRAMDLKTFIANYI